MCRKPDAREAGRAGKGVGPDRCVAHSLIRCCSFMARGIPSPYVMRRLSSVQRFESSET